MEIQPARHLPPAALARRGPDKEPDSAPPLQQQQRTSQIKSRSIVVAPLFAIKSGPVLPYKENVRAGGCLCRGERQLGVRRRNGARSVAALHVCMWLACPCIGI